MKILLIVTSMLAASCISPGWKQAKEVQLSSLETAKSSAESFDRELSSSLGVVPEKLKKKPAWQRIENKYEALTERKSAADQKKVEHDKWIEEQESGINMLLGGQDINGMAIKSTNLAHEYRAIESGLRSLDAEVNTFVGRFAH